MYSGPNRDGQSGVLLDVQQTWQWTEEGRDTGDRCVCGEGCCVVMSSLCSGDVQQCV